jgi:hypothetical protein
LTFPDEASADAAAARVILIFEACKPRSQAEIDVVRSWAVRAVRAAELLETVLAGEIVIEAVAGKPVFRAPSAAERSRFESALTESSK